MTLAVPKDLKEKMEDHKEINWSEVARASFRQKIEDLEFMRHMNSESTLTEEDALKLGRELNKKLTKRILAEMKRK